ncbi:MAG: hypothetical protein ACRDL8_10950, partial [Solirubrobacteraceae bacterium]
SCAAEGVSCTVTLRVTAKERVTRGRGRHRKTRTKTVVIASQTATIAAGRRRTVKVSLNRAGRALLAKARRLRGTLRITQTVAGRTMTLSTRKVMFKAKPNHRKPRKHA